MSSDLEQISRQGGFQDLQCSERMLSQVEAKNAEMLKTSSKDLDDLASKPLETVLALGHVISEAAPLALTASR